MNNFFCHIKYSWYVVFSWKNKCYKNGNNKIKREKNALPHAYNRTDIVKKIKWYGKVNSLLNLLHSLVLARYGIMIIMQMKCTLIIRYKLLWLHVFVNVYHSWITLEIDSMQYKKFFFLHCRINCVCLFDSQPKQEANWIGHGKNTVFGFISRCS